MRQIFGLLSTLASVYMLIITIRIILSWFRGSVSVPGVLTNITDPYLNWFRRFTFLQIGYMDLSPIAALGALSVLNQAFIIFSRYGTIRLGIILVIVLRVIWSAASFFLVFLIIVLVLRFIAYVTSQDIYSVFWRAVDTVSQPVLYRINYFFFKGRIVNYRNSLLFSISLLVGIYCVLNFAVYLFAGVLERLPF